MSSISIKNLTKQYAALRLFDDLNLKIESGSFVTILGPNGCGKSSLLNIISGLDNDYSGKVLIDDQSPQEARIGFVFQNYNESMLPWKSVKENITISPLCNKDLAAKLIQIAELETIQDRKFCNLSGGQKQLSSIIRSLAIEPNVLILDEPHSALDFVNAQKSQMRLLKIWQEYNNLNHKKLTVICVSHNIDEAILLSDKVILLGSGGKGLKQILDIGLARPRTLEMPKTDDFFAIRTQVLEAFEGG
jgi:NitT/TauT family transport system ATP-binding protein